MENKIFFAGEQERKKILIIMFKSMFQIPSTNPSMKLSLSEDFVSNIIVTMVISNKSCCKHVLFTNLSDFISTTTRVTSLKSKKFLFCSFSVAKFGIAPLIGY